MSFNLNKLVQPECGAPNPLVAAAQQISTMNKASTATPMTSLLNSQQSGQQVNPVHAVPINFTKEFTQHVQISSPINPSSLAGCSKLNTPSNYQQQTNYNKQLQLSNFASQSQIGHQPLHPMQYFGNNFIQQQQQQQQQGTCAGDQLETKYRNDMISQSTTRTDKLVEQEQSATSSKEDDLAFWQSLSQTYMGPNTMDGIAVQAAHNAKKASQKQIDSEPDTKDEQENLASLSEDWFGDVFGEQEAAPYEFERENPLKEKFSDPFAEGLRRLEMGDIPSAVLLFEAAVQREPDNALAWQYLGTTQAQNEKDRAAIKALEECLRKDENNQAARLAIAASLVNETRDREACDYLLEWLSRHPKYGPKFNASDMMKSYKQIDNTLHRQSPEYSQGVREKKFEFVRDRFVEAARLTPRAPDPEVQSSLGVLFNMRAEFQMSVDCFKAALSVSPDDALLWNRLGATLANGFQPEDAVVAYKRALEIAPGFLRSRYNLAISLVQLNLYDEAARQLLQILNAQAAGNDGTGARSLASSAVWNTLRTVVTLMNRPELYGFIENRRLAECNAALMAPSENSN